MLAHITIISIVLIKCILFFLSSNANYRGGGSLGACAVGVGGGVCGVCIPKAIMPLPNLLYLRPNCYAPLVETTNLKLV